MRHARGWVAFGALAGSLFAMASAAAEPGPDAEFERPMLNRRESVNVTGEVSTGATERGGSIDVGVGVDTYGGETIAGIDLKFGLPYICKSCDKLCGGGGGGGGHNPPKPVT